MFALTAADLDGAVLGCADGPASFNAEATRRGARVVSCDPLYRHSSSEIRARIDTTYPQMMQQARENCHLFNWTEFTSPDDLGRARMEAMETFIHDYDAGRSQGRYVADTLPTLSFDAQSFDLCLCSHLLFLYTDQLTEDFHIRSVLELSRVSREVRIFPLVTLGGVPSRHLDPVRTRLQEARLSVTIERVPYEFVRGANEMLRVRRNSG